MKRRDLEHILRAAGAVAEVDHLVIVGSQAILGQYPDAPEELLVSQEADLYPPDAPDKADVIDGSIGEGSLFHEQFGYYAHGVGPETAKLPCHWKQRLVPIRNENTRGVTGWCLHPGDLVISKLLAGRDRDIAFVGGVLRHGLVSEEDVQRLFAELPEEEAGLVSCRLRRCR
jgi:hypothetical protein